VRRSVARAAYFCFQTALFQLPDRAFGFPVTHVPGRKRAPARGIVGIAKMVDTAAALKRSVDAKNEKIRPAKFLFTNDATVCYL
jgi:hypothetical protein